MFTDINRDYKDWDAISYVIEAGLMSGFPDGSFLPYGGITFGTFCMVLSRLFPPENGMIEFISGHWALGYVKYCKERNFFSDDIDDLYRMVDTQVTNKQLSQTIRYLSDRFKISSSVIDNLCHDIEMFDAFASRISLAKLLYHLAIAVSRIVCSLAESSKSYELLTLLNKHRKRGYYRNYKQLLPSDISHAYDVLLSYSHEDDQTAFYNMMKTSELKRAHFYQVASVDKIFHYTSLNVLQKLIQPGGRLRLSPIAYLNDPTEGTIGVELAESVMRNKAYGPFFTNWDDILKVFLSPVSSSTLARTSKRTAVSPCGATMATTEKGVLFLSTVRLWVRLSIRSVTRRKIPPGDRTTDFPATCQICPSCLTTTLKRYAQGTNGNRKRILSSSLPRMPSNKYATSIKRHIIHTKRRPGSFDSCRCVTPNGRKKSWMARCSPGYILN